MKILITGGAGFIGSHLAERLLDDGNGVVALDNLSTGSLDNVAAPRQASRVRVRDRLGPRRVAGRRAGAGVRRHRASRRRRRRSADPREAEPLDPHERQRHRERRPRGFVAREARDHRVHVGGLRQEHEACRSPRTTTWSSGRPPICAGRTRARRRSTSAWRSPTRRRRSSRRSSCRLFNTTGPRQTGHYGMVLPGFVSQALKGEPITVYGSGTQIALLRARCRRRGIAGAAHEHAERARRDLQRRQRRGDHDRGPRREGEAGARRACSDIRKVPYSEVYGAGFEDMARRVPDVRKLERFIGYRPRTPLDRIIADIVAEQRARR